MSASELCSQYVKAVNALDRTSALALFSSGCAEINSPLYGLLDARTYFERRFTDGRMKEAETSIIEIHEPLSDAPTVAMKFSRKWAWADGTELQFNGWNLFEMTPDRTRFTRMTCIYNLADTIWRSEFHEAGKN